MDEKYTDVAGNTRRQRAYTFTKFGDEDLPFNDKQMKYMISGKEICPETKREHYQGYVYFHNAKTLGQVIKKYSGPHWEQARGSIEANIAYCSKDDKFREFGERPQRGKRTDIHAAVETLLEEGMGELMEKHPDAYIKYHKGFEKLHLNNIDNKVEEVEIKNFTGKKSHAIIWTEMEYGEFYHKNNLKWWDGYLGQPTILISRCNKDELEDLKEGITILGETKGGFVQVRAQRLVIWKNATLTLQETSSCGASPRGLDAE